MKYCISRCYKKINFANVKKSHRRASKLRPESKSASSLPETSACSRAQYIANYTIDLSPGTNFLQYFNTSSGSQGNIPILSFPIFRRDTSSSRSPCFLRAKHFLSLTLNSNVTFRTAQCRNASLDV